MPIIWILQTRYSRYKRGVDTLSLPYIEERGKFHIFIPLCPDSYLLGSYSFRLNR